MPSDYDRDNDDDRPRRRRYRDEDDDDRPRRREGPPQKSNPMVIVAIVIGVIFGGGLVVAILIALLLPAVQRVRDASARMSDSNNLQQISLGVHSHDDANRTLPPADGNVSWRVHLLPYIGENDLYRQFDLNQPWDSPSNKRLASQRIRVYTSAGDPQADGTHFRVFVGPHTLFKPGEKPMALKGIPDGVSNTILVIEASETVPWPAPWELQYDRNAPLPPLGIPGRKVFLVAMADGSVHSVTKDISPEVLRGGIEPDDGRKFNPADK